MRYYPYDRLNYFTGDLIDTIESNKPPRSSELIPPALAAGEFAVWNGKNWNVTTVVPDYSGLTVDETSEKLIAAKDIIQILPVGTEWYLEKFVADIDIADTTAAGIEKRDKGFTAKRALTLLYGGEKLNVYSSAFDTLAAWMVLNIPGVEQSHIDTAKAL